MKEKPKIAFFSLTSCEGCQFVLLDLGERFFDFLNKVELVDFSLIEEMPFPKEKPELDIAFVEGLPIKKEEIQLLKKIRKESKILVAIGNCATLGGVPEIKNYQGKEKTIRHIYRHLKNIENPQIRPVDAFVKVDFYLTGCPINGEEFLEKAKELIEGKIPHIPQIPVCRECFFQGKKECFLRKREICFGPITLGGCGAVCPNNGVSCLACRGLLKNINPQNFLLMLEKFKPKKEVEENLEIFGIKDSLKYYERTKNH